METQRLITVSLGKIAQSRCQRGGINLHKNLLVATVLYKARTAYMMENYNYQQTVTRTTHQQQYSGCVRSQSVDDTNKGETSSNPDCNLGHSTPVPADPNMSVLPTFIQNDLVIPEPVKCQEMEAYEVHDKENSPPCLEGRLIPTDNSTKSTESVNHLSASILLSQEAQLTSSSNNSTCKVLKRRRHNQENSYSELDCPVSKKARVSCEGSLSSTYPDYSDSSSDESEIDTETSDSPQISNLVNIFNSGFSGLCAVTNESVLNSAGYDSDTDISSSQFSHTRPESPAFSRILSEPSLLCSTQVNRLESMPSAIILSA